MIRCIFAYLCKGTLDNFHLTIMVTPVCEEILKALPLLFTAIMISDNREVLFQQAMSIGLDLNKGGQRKIYLAYKTSTNVDDAITDLAVMNMEGNFSMGNYEHILSENIENFAEVAKDYRVMAAEFAANYAAGNINAQTAYRQMNLYYNEENGVKTYMGDYMLNFPATDEGFAAGAIFMAGINKKKAKAPN